MSCMRFAPCNSSCSPRPFTSTSVVSAYLADPLWVLSQEDLERVKLLGNTLDVVQSVDSDDELDALELSLELLDSLLDVGFADTLERITDTRM